MFNISRKKQIPAIRLMWAVFLIILFLEIAVIYPNRQTYAAGRVSSIKKELNLRQGSPGAKRHHKQVLLQLQAEQIEVRKVNEFDWVTLPESSHISRQGHPALPIKPVVVKLPRNTTVTAVRAPQISSVDIPGEYHVAPALKPELISNWGGRAGSIGKRGKPMKKLGKGALFFSKPQPAIYTSSVLYPNRFFDCYTSKGRDCNYVIIYLYPLQYTPTDGKLTLINEAAIEIEYTTADGDGGTSGGVIEGGGIQSMGFGALSGSSLDAVIITHPDYEGEAETLAEWRTLTHIKTTVYTTTWIYSNYTGIDDPKKIRNFIKDMFDTYQIKYVILLGDEDDVPTRFAYVPDGDDGAPDGIEVPTDYYYECLDGTWDFNGDGQYADIANDGIENLDFIPEVSVGRLSVNNAASADQVVNKIINYEQNIDPAWFRKMLLLGTDPFTDPEAEGPEGEILKDYIEGILTSDFDIFTKLYETEATLSVAAATANINAGQGGVNFAGHGNYTLWSFGTSGTYYNSDAAGLTNGNELPLICTMACLTAGFDSVYNSGDCIGEVFLRNPNGGASAYVGATRTAWGYLSSGITEGLGGELDWQFWKSYNLGFTKPGDMLTQAKIRYIARHPLDTLYGQYYLDEKTILEYVLLGDPALLLEELLTISLSNPAGASFLTVGEPFTMDGSVSSKPGVDCGVVSAWTQLWNGTAWQSMTSSTDLSTTDTNPYDCGQLGGYTTPASDFGAINFDTATEYDPTVPEYTKTDSPPSALVGGTGGGIIIEFQDSFEGTSIDTGKWTMGAGWDTDTERFYCDSRSAHVDGSVTDTALTSVNIDLSGKTDVLLDFWWYIESGLDSGEYLSLDIYDGSWHNSVDSLDGASGTGLEENTWFNKVIDLGANYNMVSDFKIRFRATMNSINEDAFVDCVNITLTANNRYYLKFSLPSIPTGALIESAALTLYVNTAETGATGEVYHADQAYDSATDAQTVHQDGPPSYCLEQNPIGTFDASTAGSKAENIRGAVQEAVDEGIGYLAFQIRESGEDRMFQVAGSAGTSPPSLEITYKEENPTSAYPWWNVTGQTGGLYKIRIHVESDTGLTANSPSHTIHQYPGSGASAYRMDKDGDGVDDYILESLHLIGVFEGIDNTDRLIKYLYQKDTAISYTFSDISDSDSVGRGEVTTANMNVLKFSSFSLSEEGENLGSADLNISANISKSASSSLNVLVIDDDDDETTSADLFNTVLTDAGHTVTQQTSSATTPATWTSYDMLVWASHDDTNPINNLSTITRDALISYVNGGGRLIMEGGEIGYISTSATWQNFREQVLFAGWIADGFSNLYNNDCPTHPIATTPNLLPDPIDAISSTYGSHIDVCLPLAGGDLIYYMANLDTGGIIVHDDDADPGNGGQVVFISIAMEVIDSSTDRRHLIENLAGWLSPSITAAFNLAVRMKSGDVDFLLYKLTGFDQYIGDLNEIFSPISGTLGSSVADDSYHIGDGTDDLVSSLASGAWTDFSALTDEEKYVAIYDNSSTSDSVDDNVISWVYFPNPSTVGFQDVGCWYETGLGALRIRYDTTSATISDQIEYILAFTQGDYTTIAQWMSAIAGGDYPAPNFMTPPSVLGVSVNPNSWPIGLISEGWISQSTEANDITVTNTGSVNETFTLKITPGGSSWAPGTTAGNETYVMWGLFCGPGDSPGAGLFQGDDIILTSPSAATANQFGDPSLSGNGLNIATGNSVDLWFQFQAPTITMHGGEEQSITVTIGAQQP